MARSLPKVYDESISAVTTEAVFKEGRKGQELRSTPNHICIAQLSLAGLAWVAALALLPFSYSVAAAGQSFPLAVSQKSITIYDAPYVMDNFTLTRGGQLMFTDRSGRRWPLVVDPASSVISNKGDGKFHTFDPEAVAAACEAISYPLDRLSIEVFILPYPRVELLDSSCDDGAIYLSPGMEEMRHEQAHLVVTHEIGHCVHRALMPDSDVLLWDEYRRLRDIENKSVYNSNAPHYRRPHEIFAEDFRLLFGGSLSTYSGTIENQDLRLPNKVPGLKEFMLSLADVRLARSDDPAPSMTIEISSFPNPFANTATVNLKVGQPISAAAAPRTSVRASAVVFDAKGRSVKELGMESHAVGPFIQFRWDGTDRGGRRVPSGVYFLKVDVNPGGASAIHKMLLKR